MLTLLRFFTHYVWPLVLGVCLLAGAGCSFAEDSDSDETETPDHALQIRTDFVDINASWPVLGIQRVDEESAEFVKLLTAEFEQEINDFLGEIEEKNTVELVISYRFPYELTITHEVTEPSDRVVSILWNIWRFTGGAHGQLDIVSNNYDRTNGFPLLLEDLFIDPELAVLQFTRFARKQLSEPDAGTEGEGLPDDMLRAGTEPIAENFETFTLLPDGIRLHFQPYQVAPWAVGPQTVDIPLDELMTAKPNLEFWIKEPAE